MSILGVVGDIATNIFSGGLTGLAGVGLSMFKDIAMKKLSLQELKMKFDNAVQLREIDNKMMQWEWENRLKVAQVEAERELSVEEQRAFAKSFESDNIQYSAKVKPTGAQAWLLIFIDLVRAIIRPGMAIGLFVLTCLLYKEMYEIAGGWTSLTQDQAFDLVMRIVNTILYLFTTCVTWYYGVRNSQQAPGLDRRSK